MKTLCAALCLPLCLPFLLTGCVQGEASAALAPATTTQARGTDEGERRLLAYRLALLPLFAGTYDGHCRLGPEFTIERSGQVAAPGMAHDLLASGTEFILSRKFIDGRASEAHVIAGQASPKWGVFLNTGNEEMANFGHAGASVRCGASALLHELKSRSLHAAVGGWLVAPPQSLACIVGMRERRDVPYQADLSDIRLGPHVFSFTRNVEAEQVFLARALSYKVDYAGGARIIVSLDAQGKLAELAATAPGGISYFCSGGKQVTARS